MSDTSNQTTLLKVENLKKHFPIKKGLLGRVGGYVYAVDGVSFELKKGETLGLVGESGCGKTTIGRCILRIYQSTEGNIIYEGKQLRSLKGQELFNYRKKVQGIFQDPYSSLNPKFRVREIIGEALKVHHLVPKNDWVDRVHQLMKEVGLQPHHSTRYPHEFSGGQRQRIGIARALAMNPEMLVADEPVSALDVSIQAQVINLLDELKKKYDLSYLVISHDLAVIEHISDRIAVMYLGEIAEYSTDKEIYLNPLHPYTVSLLDAIPRATLDAKKRRNQRKSLEGDVPSPVNPPQGCKFHTRCPKVMSLCKQSKPVSKQVIPDHWVSCHLY